MRYFICSLKEIFLGISAEQTEQIIQLNDVQNIDQKAGAILSCISPAELFKLNDINNLHGLILKSCSQEKTIIAVPKIETDLDIPDEKIQKLPQILCTLLWFIKGCYFNESKLILIINEKDITGMNK